MLTIGKTARVDPAIITSTAALQVALGGSESVIRLGEGIFNMDAVLTLPPGKTLEGVDPTKTTLNWNVAAAGSAIVSVSGGGGGIMNQTRIRGIGFTNTGGGALASVDTVESFTTFEDLLSEVLPILARGSWNKVTNCAVTGAGGGITLAGVQSIVEKCRLLSAVVGILIDADACIASENIIVGDGATTFGIRVAVTRDFIQVLGNNISAVGGTPGHGIGIDSVAGQNLVATNICHGAFGGSGILFASGTPGTTHAISNMTAGGLVLNGATGLGNT
ncbi:hypothetical protein LCGC14_0583740 [marine sediment metagenome]|uniref:Right handed beta helix domain-containing protein n=1 Tax=marine sediment metagenome TaxID=412755 RepID=A0A0F9UNV7_9ZZZZ